MATPGTFYFLCLASGCLIAGVFSVFEVQPSIQYIAFAFISLISLFTIRPIFKRTMKRIPQFNSNVDALIGKKAIVTQDISQFKNGFVKIESEIWLAESDTDIKTGEEVIIEAISGTKLKVKKEV
jgi:membrane protein implicated in regulation of membrane protease activity